MRWNNSLAPFENKTIAVDFDGTVVSDKFPEIGEPNIELINWLYACKLKGCKLILWTCRSNNVVVGDKGVLDNAIDFCKSVGLEFDAINENLKSIQEKWGGDTRKVLADYYLDDKAIAV